MPMAEEETRQRLCKEYEDLYAEFRKLHDKLSPFLCNAVDRAEHEQLRDLGRRLTYKHNEILIQFYPKRTLLPADSD